MAKAKGTSGPIIIKKYANRRLYDTSTSSYVTLDHLSDLVHKGLDFEVRDAKSGEDLTRAVLTQIIFEKETKGDGALPLNFLRQLIGFYGGGAQSFLPAWLDMSMNSFAEAQERWRKALGGAHPIALFEVQAKRNVELFERAMTMFVPQAGMAMRPRREPFENGDAGEHEPANEEAGAPEPGLDPLSAIQQQMLDMQRQLAELAKRTTK